MDLWNVSNLDRASVISAFRSWIGAGSTPAGAHLGVSSQLQEIHAELLAEDLTSGAAEVSDLLQWWTGTDPRSLAGSLQAFA
jgi:hypothetical protein